MQNIIIIQDSTNTYLADSNPYIFTDDIKLAMSFISLYDAYMCLEYIPIPGFYIRVLTVADSKKLGVV